MENLDFNIEHWQDKKCPPINCRKKACECGLEKVFLSSALGDDSKDSPIAPKNGAYCNAIVVYEANNHVYIYSKEGIPTLVETGGSDVEEIIEQLENQLAQEILDRQAADNALQGEIDAIKNSPDVVDIVATYAALQTYDTSKLGDNDIVRVLADEQHDGASTYYRWNKQSSTWTYIGEVGDYYTKGQVDTLLADKQDELTAGENISIAEDGGSLVISALGNVRVLTTDDYNYPENNPSGVGVWKLEAGVYRTEGSVNIYPHIGTLIIPSQYELIFVSGKSAYVYTMRYNGAKTMAMFSADRTTGVGQDEGSIFSNSLVVDNLTSTSASDPLSANQGKTLKDLIDGLIISGASAPTTSTVGTVGQLLEDTTNGKLYQCTAIDTTDPNNPSYTWTEVGGGGGDTVYSTKTTSNVVDGGAVYIGNLDASQEEQPDPTTTDNHYKYFWALPYENSISPENKTINILGAYAKGNSVVIGDNANNPIGTNSVAIGSSATSRAQNSVALGDSAYISNNLTYSVALGARSIPTRAGEVNIGTGNQSYGYNSTNYRVIGGVHDPVNAHDAATKNYVDSIVVNYATLTAAGAPTTSTAATSVGQLYYDSTNDDYYYCSAIDTTDPDNPVYTWSALSTGGGGGDTVYSNKTTSNSNTGGAVYIGNLDTNQDEQSDPTSVDNHYKYFWALPSSNANIPKDRSINLLGASADEYGITIGAGAYGGSGKYYSVIIGSSAYSSDHSVVAIGMSANGRAENSIAIGRAAKVDTATYKNSIALGSYASVSRKGEVNVGTGNNSVGYNNTDYRVIGGVHDGQLAQDAVTVNQVNSLIDNLNSALNTNIPHIGA